MCVCVRYYLFVWLCQCSHEIKGDNLFGMHASPCHIEHICGCVWSKELRKSCACASSFLISNIFPSVSHTHTQCSSHDGMYALHVMQYKNQFHRLQRSERWIFIFVFFSTLVFLHCKKLWTIWFFTWKFRILTTARIWIFLSFPNDWSDYFTRYQKQCLWRVLNHPNANWNKKSCAHH